MRIVSLVPSGTEIVGQLGLCGSLVGRSHACDHPPGVLTVPTLTGQPIGVDTGFCETDEQVGGFVARPAGLYTLDTQQLVDLKPDVVLLPGAGSDAALEAQSVQAALEALGSRAAVVRLSPRSIEDMLDDVLRVGAACGREAAAGAVVARLRGRLFEAMDRVTAFDPYRPVVGFLEWTDPLFTAGHWNVQLIERAGGRHPLNETVRRAEDGAASGPQQAQRLAGPAVMVSPEVFAAVGPEFVVVSPCGYGLERAVEATRALWRQEWFRNLPAARSGRVAAVDGSAMFSRPGPRVVDALEFLVGWLQGRAEMVPTGFPWRVVEG